MCISNSWWQLAPSQHFKSYQHLTMARTMWGKMNVIQHMPEEFLARPSYDHLEIEVLDELEFLLSWRDWSHDERVAFDGLAASCAQPTLATLPAMYHKPTGPPNVQSSDNRKACNYCVQCRCHWQVLYLWRTFLQYGDAAWWWSILLNGPIPGRYCASLRTSRFHQEGAASAWHLWGAQQRTQ